MLNLFSLRTNNWRNGTQWMGKWAARAMGENNYEYFRLEKRIAYARYYYAKQSILNQMSLETPDVVNSYEFSLTLSVFSKRRILPTASLCGDPSSVTLTLHYTTSIQKVGSSAGPSSRAD